MQGEQVYANALVAALQRQRNEALDLAAQLSARLAVAEAECRRLKAAADEAPPPQ